MATDNFALSAYGLNEWQPMHTRIGRRNQDMKALLFCTANVQHATERQAQYHRRGALVGARADVRINTLCKETLQLSRSVRSAREHTHMQTTSPSRGVRIQTTAARRISVQCASTFAYEYSRSDIAIAGDAESADELGPTNECAPSGTSPARKLGQESGRIESPPPNKARLYCVKA